MKKYISLFLCVVFICAAFVSVNAFAVDENKPLTRLEAVKMLCEIFPSGEGGEIFSDTDDADVAYYRKFGIVQGKGDNTFDPDSPVKTEDFLLMLKRALDAACPDLVYDNQKIIWHYDQNVISGYAESQIAFLSSVGVYNNSGYLNADKIISVGMASYYVKLAKYAKNYGLKSENGNLGKKLPPVLMYHVIDYPVGPYEYLFVTSEDFEAQIKYLYDNGYTFLFPEELSVAHLVKKPVVITFDDGNEQTYRNAFPILKKYKAKATLYMVADMIDTYGYCTSSQLREMSDSGVFRINSHTLTHPYLTDLTSEEIEREFAQANDKIYSITRRDVTSVAFPYGYFDEKVLLQAKRYYKTAFGVNKSARTPMRVPSRYTVDGTLDMSYFKSIFE